MEEHLKEMLEGSGYLPYVALFIWTSVIEGEIGLLLVGAICYIGSMDLFASILVATVGATIGDLTIYWVAYKSSNFFYKKLEKYKRKVIRARYMIKKYGVWVVITQRFIYGFRTILCITLGLSKFSKKKFILYNPIGALVWSVFFIYLGYILGEEIIIFFEFLGKNWHFMIPLFMLFFGTILYYFKKEEKVSKQWPKS